MKVYRTSHSFSDVVKLPYPIWVPPHLALGIVSFKEVNRKAEKNRWQERIKIVSTIYNTAIETYHSKNIEKYNELKELSKMTNDAADLINKATGIKNFMTRGVEPRIESKLKKLKTTLPKPKKPKKYSVNNARSDEQIERDFKNESHGSYVIGGSSSCALDDLSTYFKIFTQACKRVEEERSAKDGTNRNVNVFVNAIRIYLHMHHSDGKARPVDALFTGNYPMIEYIMLNQTANAKVNEEDDMGARPFRFGKNENEQVVKLANLEDTKIREFVSKRLKLIGGSEDAKRKSQESIEAAKKVAQSDSEYDFVYDRFGWEERKRTLIKTSIKVHVEDFEDEEGYEFVFESEEDDGLSVHAVYTNVKEKLIALDKDMDDFMDCIAEQFGYVASSGRQNVVSDEAKKAARKMIDQTARMLLSKGYQYGAYTLAKELYTDAKNSSVFRWKGSGEQVDVKLDLKQVDLVKLQIRMGEISFMARQAFPPTYFSKEDLDKVENIFRQKCGK